jgi:hypothetical protein
MTGADLSNGDQKMHFRAQMTVLLDKPLPCTGKDASEKPAVGYVIVIGVNAPDLAAAAKYAHDIALQPRQADGTFRSFHGVVEEAKINRIEKTDWEPIIQQNAKRIDKEGVYYSTGLIFFPEKNSN